MTKNATVKPLSGRRIVVTRARGQAAGFTKSLRSRGAEVIEAPAIRIEPPLDWVQVDEAMVRLERYDWVIFTSTNGVKSFIERMKLTEREPRELEKLKLAAIGPATHAELESYGLRAEVVPTRYIAEEVFEALRRFGHLEGCRALLPRADIAREALPELLRNEGVEVDIVVVYRTVPAQDEVRRAVDLVLRGEIDIVTFTSGSTAKSFFSVIEDSTKLHGKFVAASIGPITSQALKDQGFAPEIEAKTYTSAGLLEAIVEYYSTSEQ